MIEPDFRPCPICGGNDRRIIYRQRFMEGPMGDGYNVVVCTQCGAGFADGIPSQVEMDRYYAERSKYTYDHRGGAESSWDRKRFEATAEQIEPYLKSRDARILDIGCATGGLLSVLKGKGYTNVNGADPSPACASAASRLYGLTVRCATLAQMADWEERFDIIMMLGVLEHLRDLKTAVGAAAHLLNPGGLMYCAVPDVEGLATSQNAPYQQFSVEHVNFFSVTSLKRLMAECGMAETRAWNWTFEWREGVQEPIASGLYEHRQAPDRPVDFTTESSLQRYLEFSAKGEAEILAAVDSLILSSEPIIVWGAGTLARRLLANTRFAGVNIVAFVDSDLHLQGTALAGKPILNPAQISHRKETILVCSITFSAEIAAAIRSQYGLSNRIYSLLGDVLREN